MANILIRCSDCGAPFTADEDSPAALIGLCPKCAVKQLFPNPNPNPPPDPPQDPPTQH